MDLSIIIVNYNTTDYLQNCLKSIFKFAHNLTFEVIVVDNNSSERVIDNFPSEFPEVYFYFLDSNKGFGYGCNYGASKARGKYLAFVNPDIIFNSFCLSDLFYFMESNHKVAVCSPVMKDYEGNFNYIYNYFPNYIWEFHEALGMGNDKKIEELISVLDDPGNGNKALEVDWVTGACLFMRRVIFEEQNGYDDDFFLYYEDTDLQYRIKKSGSEIMILKEFVVMHYTNSSIKSDKGEDVYFFHINRSKLIYMYKHFNFLKRNIIRFLHLLGILVRIITLPFRSKFAGKKMKRFKQYERMFLIYLSGYKSILKSNLNDI